MFSEHASAREKSQVEAFFFAMKTERYIVPAPKTYYGLAVMREAHDAKVAGLIGKSVSLASKIRYGLRTVSEADAQLIAYLLGVDLDFLFEPYERKKSK